MKIKNSNQLHEWLAGIAKTAVTEALEDIDTTSAEKSYQRNLEKRISATVPPGDDKKSKKDEDDDDIFAGGDEKESRKKSFDDTPSDDFDDTEKDKKDAGFEAKDVTTDAVIDRLNVIRSGKSLKDKNVGTEMERYINDLNDNEKIALYSYLKAIASIVVADVDGKDAPEPKEEPYDIRMKRVKDLELKRKEKKEKTRLSGKEMDKRIKNVKTAPTRVSSGSKENTKPPISVGSRASESVKREMKQLLVK